MPPNNLLRIPLILECKWEKVWPTLFQCNVILSFMDEIHPSKIHLHDCCFRSYVWYIFIIIKIQSQISVMWGEFSYLFLGMKSNTMCTSKGLACIKCQPDKVFSWVPTLIPPLLFLFLLSRTTTYSIQTKTKGYQRLEETICWTTSKKLVPEW